MGEKEIRDSIFEYINKLPSSQSTYQTQISRGTGLSKPTVARYVDVMYFDGTLKDMLIRTRAGKMVIYIKK